MCLRFNLFLKRLFDIVSSFCAIVVLTPLWIVVGVWIKLDSEGPILFKQGRRTKDGRVFKMWKYRSMVVNAENMGSGLFSYDNDPRITKSGAVLRKTSIDELPQLFNVLKGDMSLIGPRPERPLFVEKFKEEIPRYMIKHQVRPGMTGWAQVCGFRGDTSIEGRIEHDIFYIENWTLAFDIKILFLTVFKGFVNKNAY